MSERRINHPGMPTRLIDEGPASVRLDPLAVIGSLSASAIRETVPGPTGGAGPVVRTNGHATPGPLADLTQASAAAEEAWKRKQAADAAWDIAREAVASAVASASAIVWPAVPSLVNEPLPPVEPKPTQADRDAQSRRNGQAAMQAAKKTRKPMSAEARENMRQAALRRHSKAVPA